MAQGHASCAHTPPTGCVYLLALPLTVTECTVPNVAIVLCGLSCMRLCSTDCAVPPVCSQLLLPLLVVPNNKRRLTILMVVLS